MSRDARELPPSALGVVTWTWDLRTDEVTCPEGLGFFGKTGGPAATFLETMHAEDAPLVARWQESVRAGSEPLDHRFRVRTPTGVKRLFARARRVGDVIQGLCIDLGDGIPELDTEHCVRVALDHVTDAFTVLRAVRDDTGAIVDFEWLFANAEASRPLLRSAERLVGARLLEVLPGNRDTLFPHYVAVVERGEPYQAEIEYARDGIVGWFENRTVRVGDGVAIWFRDVTSRHRAEAELRAARERFRAIFEEATTPIVVSRQDVYVEANAAFCRLVRGERSQVVGARANTFVPRGMLERALEFRRTLDAEGAWAGEIPILRLDGTVVDVRCRATRTSEGRVLFFEDITEEKQAAQRREEILAMEREARALAEREARARDEFISIVSHELRSPLNAVLGWASLLRRRPEPIVFEKALDAIERGAKTQARMLSDLLDLASLDRGKLALERETLSLADVVRGEVDALAPSFDSAGVAIELEIVGKGCVRGDATRLGQIASNLLSNALKFTPRGGRVSVRLAERDGRAVLSVEDDGAGIPAEVLPFVFERFRQADASTTRRHGGLGLGLAIVKQLVDAHGGVVRAESAGEGKGARFTVSLPLVDEVDMTAAEGAAPALPSLAGMRLLVVEDDEDSREMIRHVLVEHGADVVEATNGRAGLEALRSLRPSVIVSDVGMPELDGLEMIEAIRRDEALSDIPAVAVTAFTRDRERVLAAGFDDHVPKPVEPSALVRTVAKVANHT